MRDLIDALERQRKLEEGSIGSERTEDYRSYSPESRKDEKAMQETYEKLEALESKD